MNDMDEITYWIYTKRAPCLMNYDNVIKNQSEVGHGSKSKPKSVPSVVEVPSPKKKKNNRRLLSLLDDDSLSEKRHNVFFDTTLKQKKTSNLEISNYEVEMTGSDVDFNIKKSSVQEKPKKKLQKNSRTVLHKKNTVVTSTPKVSALRRSLRQAQQSLNNNSQLNSSFEIFNASNMNGNSIKCSAIEQKSTDKSKKTELLAGGDQSVDNKKHTVVNSNSKNVVLNGQFEDLSDVSGFTANYIRSTKIQSKTPRKLRCKNSRNLVKESRPSLPKDNTVACVNKSMNTGLPTSTLLNCSTDSSQNIINLVTEKTNDKATKISKSTSLLKFMDTKNTKSRESVANNRVESNRTRSKPNLNISFESKDSGTSRYPKRFRNVTEHTGVSTTNDVSDKRKKTCKNPSVFNNSDRKENPEATCISKTRSGRNIGLTLRQPENSVLVLSNSTEQVSSMASMNVASPGEEQRGKPKKKRRVTRQTRARKMEKNVSLHRDSRDKSGFTACFSDSDEDSEPLKRRRFFCA